MDTFWIRVGGLMLGLGVMNVAACGSGTPGPAPAPAPPPSAPRPEPVVTSPAVPVVTSGWTCVGDPPDVAPGWKTEIAVVPAKSSNPIEQAMKGAQEKLRAKLCVNADRDVAAADACSFLASKIEPWKTGTNERDVCASAVIKSQYVEEWQTLASSLDAFDKRLAASAQQLLRAVASKTPRIALAAVYDDNVAESKQNQLPGGRRADWLAARFRAQFPSGLVGQPKGWSDGQVAPAGYDLVVVGRMFKRTGVTLPTVEVSWTAHAPDGRQIESASGTFPEAAAPSPPASNPPPIPTTKGLFLSMDSDHVGSICAGETTQLWLKSSEQLHVRVIDLYGKDGAMIVFPPDRSKSDVVPAGKTIPLGDEKGFEAVPLPGMEDERYLVIAAPTVAGLGRFANAAGYCRFPPAEASALHRGEGLPPGAQTAVTGYRLLTGKNCPPAPSAEHVKAAGDALARLPVCAR